MNADPGPGDVATLRRLLVESEERNAELRAALKDITRVADDPNLRLLDRVLEVAAIASTALRPKEEQTP